MKRSALVVLLVVTAGFLAGLGHLFNLRFEAGDIYPEYSSLRADPLGTKALYESLGKLVPARRHYQPFARLRDGEGATLFYLGARPADLRLTREDWQALETFVTTGGRSSFHKRASSACNRR